ncbi:right-handed parallel beta-helix repeat-containing protein [Virgisporangium ochraceum]|uniref:Right handed beta helix domain-containing protein n=1 Tax=Virgisporangium ochraceum TaxID=65505 RepID=A0A8J4A0D2_9ACTN|nr:right-handed parallel beta-helix repeat-containing protein [Virgisporangium ochraceum]GIJ71790.1 hypothetical protein Voc01_067070 [Virgisporangium ochraceum]
MTEAAPDATDPDTTGLARAAQAGDPTAMDTLVESHLTLVYNVIGRVLNACGRRATPNGSGRGCSPSPTGRSSCICACGSGRGCAGTRSTCPTRVATSLWWQEISGELTRRWSGAADPVWRKRLVRHVRDCPRCRRFQAGLVAPDTLLLGAAVLPVPVAVLAAVQAALHARALRTVAFGPMVLSYLPAAVQRRAVAAATAADGRRAVRAGSPRRSTSARTAPAARRVTVVNFRDERPVLDASGIPADKWAVTQQTAYWTVQGLEIRGAPTHAWMCRACSNTVFRSMSSHHNGPSGLMLRDDGTVNNQVLDSDFHDNGTGLSVQFGDGAGNLVRGNRAYGNPAAGYDLGTFRSPVSIEYTWAYGNGAKRVHVRRWPRSVGGRAQGAPQRRVGRHRPRLQQRRQP